MSASSLAAAALTMLALGCGGGDDKNAGEAQGSQAAEAKAEYIARGDEVCDRFRTAQDAVVRELERAGKAKDASGLAKSIGTIADASKQAYDDFAAIPKPSGDEAVLNRYISLQRRLTGILDRAAAAYRSGDEQKGTAILDSNPKLSDRSRALARDYGFQVCGSG